MQNLTIRTLWQQEDSATKEDVARLWDELGSVLPRDRADRLNDLVAAAYDGKNIVGAATARAIEYRVLRAQVFHLRPDIRPGPWHDTVFLKLLAAAKSVLQPWAKTQGRQKGILVIFNSDAYDGLYPEPVIRREGLELILSGGTDEGRQIRMVWFDDARLEK